MAIARAMSGAGWSRCMKPIATHRRSRFRRSSDRSEDGYGKGGFGPLSFWIFRLGSNGGLRAVAGVISPSSSEEGLGVVARDSVQDAMHHPAATKPASWQVSLPLL